jgi:hypothetical protein
MMKRILPLLMLIGVIVLSGCVGQDGTQPTGTNGLIIKDFSFSPPGVITGESTELYIEVQNVGGDTAYLKKITVFGVDTASTANELQWGSSKSFAVNLAEDLIPPDPSTGFEGDFYPDSWPLQAPTGVKAKTSYDFGVRVEYSYTTTFTGFIRLMEDNYLKTLPREERDTIQKVGGVVNPSITAGPLSVAAASGRHFIIRTGDNSSDRTIKFKITNVGSGFPYGNDINANLYQVTITSLTQGLFDCDNNVTLSKGKTGMFSCQISTPSATDFSGKNKLDKAFALKLTYNYFLDSSASIIVTPGT